MRALHFFLAAFLFAAPGWIPETHAQVRFLPATDTCYLFHTLSVPRFPPLHRDMPPDVVTAWIELDSACRNTTVEEVTHWAWWTTKDSLRRALDICRTVREYDPLLFHQYWTDLVEDHSCLGPGAYAIFLGEIFERRFEPGSPLTSLLFEADYIIRGRIARQTTFFKEQRSPFVKGYLTFCADVEVLEKIKGRKLYPTCGSTGELQPEDRIPESDNCIRIFWGITVNDTSAFGAFPVHEIDSLEYERQGPSYLAVGREYFLLLELGYNRSYGDTIPWMIDDIVPEGTKQHCWPIEIVDGKVRDCGNYFGLGREVPVAEFTDKIRARMATSFPLPHEMRY